MHRQDGQDEGRQGGSERENKEARRGAAVEKVIDTMGHRLCQNNSLV